MAHVESCKHPADVSPTKAAIVRVFDDVSVVVPVDELVLHHRIKSSQGQDNHQDGDRRRRAPQTTGPAPRLAITSSTTPSWTTLTMRHAAQCRSTCGRPCRATP